MSRVERVSIPRVMRGDREDSPTRSTLGLPSSGSCDPLHLKREINRLSKRYCDILEELKQIEQKMPKNLSLVWDDIRSNFIPFMATGSFVMPSENDIIKKRIAAAENMIELEINSRMEHAINAFRKQVPELSGNPQSYILSFNLDDPKANFDRRIANIKQKNEKFLRIFQKNHESMKESLNRLQMASKQVQDINLIKDQSKNNNKKISDLIKRLNRIKKKFELLTIEESDAPRVSLIEQNEIRNRKDREQLKAERLSQQIIRIKGIIDDLQKRHAEKMGQYRSMINIREQKIQDLSNHNDSILSRMEIIKARLKEFDVIFQSLDQTLQHTIDCREKCDIKTQIDQIKQKIMYYQDYADKRLDAMNDKMAQIDATIEKTKLMSN